MTGTHLENFVPASFPPRGHMLLVLVFFASAARASDLRVPADQPSIAAALAAAVDGDTIRVAPGVYVEHVVFPAKSVLLTSELAPGSATIDGSGAPGPTVTFAAGCTLNARLEGFVITGGTGGYGGGVRLEPGAAATLRRNVIRGNTASADGGGVYAYGSNAIVFESNTVESNTAVGQGGGMTSPGTGSTLRNNVFVANGAGFGGAYFQRNDSSTALVNCTFVLNTSANGSVACGDGTLVLRNCIAWAPNGPTFSILPGGNFLAEFSDIQGGATAPWFGPGCIDRDPLFAESGHRLLPTSPARDRGDLGANYVDRDGSRNDMGAYGGPAGELRVPAWHALASMPEPRFNAACTASGKRLFTIGGTTQTDARSRSVRAFTPTTNTWEALPDYPGPPIRSAAAVSAGGFVYLFGGYLYDYAISDQVWRFDPATGEWDARAPMPEARLQASVVELNGRIYVLGGRTTPVWTYCSTTLVYSPDGDAWSTGASVDLPTPLGDNSGVAIDGDLFTLGSYEPAVYSRFLVYSPRLDRWSQLSPTPFTGLVKAERIGRTLFALQGSGSFWSWEYDASVDPGRGLARRMAPTPPLAGFVALPPAPQPVYGAAIAASGGLLFACGGTVGGPAWSDVFVFDR
ncbi:MAG: right-handed parallel beta-helix repeat-containing protein [Planctomycetes bacterium]|nr:right-handed parallel beta-helix repeat-containing protein [Planctomycetota bacterium]